MERRKVLEDLIGELGRAKDLEAEIDRLQIDLNNERVARQRVERQLAMVREKCEVLERSVPSDWISPELEREIWKQGRDVTIEFRNKFGGEKRLFVKTSGRKPIRARVSDGQLILGKALEKFCGASRSSETE